MATWTPDPTFYPSRRLAAGAPPEKLAYVASFDPARRRNDEMAVVDLDKGSLTYGQIIRRVEMPGTGDELHHFGWNACSSRLCPNMPHPHVERRYLIVPGLRSSRIHILDTRPDPKDPKIVRSGSSIARRSPLGRVTPVLTPSIAVRTGSASAHLAMPRERHPAASC
jgi:selenium-binding protein 1